MGKTDTIKDRKIDVYVDTIDRKQKWAEYAEDAGTSLSDFVEQAVEYAIEQGGPNAGDLGEQAQKVQELEEEVNDLRQEIEEKEMVIEKLREEAQQHRMEPFSEDNFEGTRQYDEALIELLKESDRLTSDDIVRRLDIDRTNTAVMQGLTEQLEQLEQYGLVTNTPKGWRWDG